MKYEGITCAGCGEIFKENDDVVVCPVCGTPQHRACWMKENRCVTQARHAEGYVWQNPLQGRENEKPDRPKATDLFGRKKVCPYCGTPNTADAEVCINCGSSLLTQESERRRPFFAPDEDDVREDGPAPDPNADETTPGSYANFRLFGGLDPNDMVDGIPCWEYSEYVSGGNPQSVPGRIIIKAAAMERMNRKTSVCFAAFLFGPIWFFYRKMIKEGVALLLAQAVLLAVFLFAGITPAAAKTMQDIGRYLRQSAESGQTAMSANELMEMYNALMEKNVAELGEEVSLTRTVVAVVAETMLFPGLPILMSMFSIPIYRKKVRKDILQIREECRSMDEYRLKLRERGGTSMGLAVLAVLLTIAAAFAVMLGIEIPLMFS